MYSEFYEQKINSLEDEISNLLEEMHQLEETNTNLLNKLKTINSYLDDVIHNSFKAQRESLI